MTKKSIEERAQEYYDAVFDKELVHLMDVAEGNKKPTKREIEYYGDTMRDDPQDVAREAIERHQYGVEHENVYYVTIAGGGPAARIKVTVDDDGEIDSASLQFCDWFELWTDAPNQDAELVERYARLLSTYGEVD